MIATPAQLRALLFVLRHGGYAAAERATGIARPTLHEGVQGAEAAFDCKFFEAEPFRATHCGRIAQPFLEEIMRNLTAMEEQVGRARRPRLRIIAGEAVTSEYLPGIIAAFERRHPDLPCETDSGPEERMRALVATGEMDCAIAPASGHWKGFSRAPLIAFPLALLAPRAAGVAAASALWSRAAVPFRLAVAKSTPTLRANFDAGLQALGVTWGDRREVSSLAAVVKSVADCGDFGLVVLHPALPAAREVQVIALPNFPPVALSLFWMGRKTTELATLIELLGAAVAEIGGSGNQGSNGGR